MRRHLAMLGAVTESTPDEEQGPEHYVAVRSAGIELIVEGGVIQGVTLFPSYPGPLPLALAMSKGRPGVRDLLGEPEYQWQAGEVPCLGRPGPGDRYDRGDFSIAIEYDEQTNHVSMVQLLLPGAVPR